MGDLESAQRGFRTLTMNKPQRTHGLLSRKVKGKVHPTTGHEGPEGE